MIGGSPVSVKRWAYVGRRYYLGFVDGCGFAAGAFFAAGFEAVELPFADAPDGFFFAAEFVALLGAAAAPEDTRDECLVRCLVLFFGVAASATDVSAKAAIRATTSIFIVLRTIRIDLRSNGLNRIA
jgi:hypothetical protein